MPKRNRSAVTAAGQADDTTDAAPRHHHPPLPATAAVTLPPHVERWLRLATEPCSTKTTKNSADDHENAHTMATAQLSQWTAQQPANVVWTVLGQLLSTIVKSSSSSSWASRQQAAAALQSVATCIPVSHQQSFWQGTTTVQDNATNPDNVVGKYLDQALQCATANASSSSDENNNHESLLLYATAATIHRQRAEQAEHAYLQTVELSAQERLATQRRFLAARLGWSHLPIPQEQTLSDLVTTHDIMSPQPTEQRPSKKQAPATATTTTSSQRSLADWLVRAWHESQQRVGGNKTGQSPHDSSSFLPQAVLAHECLYHMWDTAWQIRHGALLAIMALLRAWQTHVLLVDNKSGSPYKPGNGTDSVVAPSQLGPWPREILGRAVLLLVLDRFGDFAGGTVHGSNNDDRAVVAPVRELSAQLVALVYKAAPQDVQTHCWSTLTAVVEQSSIWECQHGALLAIRYIIVLVTAESSSDKLTVSSWYHSCLVQAEATASACLSSSSLDVAAVAAQVLAVLPPSYLTHVHALWESAPRDVHLCRLVASSHMIPRLAEVLVMPVTDVVGRVQSMLLPWISSGLASVRILALQALEDVLRYNPLSSEKETHTSCVSPAPDDALHADIVRKLFEAYIQLAQEKSVLSEEEFATYDDAQRQLDSTWASYASFGQTRLSVVHWTALLRDLVETYFYAPFAMRRPGKYYLLLGPPRAALSMLIRLSDLGKHHSEWDSYWLVSSLHKFLQSPWREHCELACGLIQSLSNSHSVTKMFLRSLYVPLSELLEYMPLCLQVHKCGADSILGDEWIMKHRENMRNPSRTSTEAQSLDGFRKEDIQRIISDHGLDLGSQTYGTSDLESMRLKAMGASAALSLDFPSTITPFVRALMTSMKNDTLDFRLNETADALSHLLEASHTVQSHSAARTKIVKVLSGMVKQAGANDNLDVAYHYASKALGGYLGLLSDVLLPDAVKEFEFESAVSLADTTSPKETEDALLLLESICRVVQDIPRVTAFLVKRYIEGLCLLSQSGASSSVRQKSRRCIQFFCTVTAGDDIGFAFPFAVKLIDKETTTEETLWSCLLLKDLCDVSPAVLARYVRLLLPRILKSMTHADRRVAETASAVFSVLVRVAPLVDKFTTGRDEQSDDIHTTSVIDHLIQGKPLPHTKLPTAIKDALHAADVELRDYQLEGISWIHFLMSVNLNGALCDSMGLGKTLQALIGVALSHEKYGDESFPRSLVVCPATIVNHWVSEIRRFFPGDGVVFTPQAVVGDASKREKFWATFARSKVNIVVVSYSTMRADISKIAATKWTYCILDEGHVLRNPKTATAAASRLVPSKHRLVLSGTMIQNKVLDVWATFDFLMPNFLGSSKEFTEKYVRPITKSHLHGASADSIQVGVEKLRTLHQQVLPFILRREKEQVLRELPPKNITNLKCQMSILQRRLYSAFSESKEAKESMALFHRDSELTEDRMGAKALRVLLFLRLICTHPSLIDPKIQKGSPRGTGDTQYNLSSSGKFSALFDLLRDSGVNSDSFLAGDRDESLVYLDSPEDEAGSDLESTGISLEYDDTPLGTVPLPGNDARKPKCLVFAQFSQTLDAIENFLFKPHMPSLRYLRLDGSVPPENRVEVAERFNTDSSISVLLLTTRVGSLGLNLTGASIVIFMEHDFNPFVDEQAMDRVHRLGQQADSVNVYRLIASDSIDEKIMDVQAKKTATSRAVVNTENSTLYSLGTDRLLDIFAANNAADSSDETLQDLDAILSSCAKDYESLSVDEFIRSFVSQG